MKRLSEAEYEMARIIWKNQPMSSGDLVIACESNMGWKKSTTYTILKRMIEKEVAMNRNSMVSMIVSKDEIDTEEAKDLMTRSFEGSLPCFVTAYMRGKKLSRSDAEELKQLISKYTEKD